MTTPENIHTEFHRFLERKDKERLLQQKGVVTWLYGLSGSGKSTIANIAERRLHEAVFPRSLNLHFDGRAVDVVEDKHFVSTFAAK